MTGHGLLQWMLEDTMVVEFTVQDEPGSEPGPLPDVVNVTLINVEKDDLNGLLGNLTSTLTVIVNQDTIEKHVNCSDGRNTRGIIIEKQRIVKLHFKIVLLIQVYVLQ